MTTPAIEPSADEIELKPCPHCGANLEHNPVFSNRTSTYYVHPASRERCVAESFMVDTSNSKRVAAWNRRAAILAMDRRAEVVGEPAGWLWQMPGMVWNYSHDRQHIPGAVSRQVFFSPPAPAVAVPEVTDAMVDAALFEYSEGGCMGLSQQEKREVVWAILHTGLAAAPEPPATRSEEPADVNSIWREVFGDPGYTPFRWRKHQAIRPNSLKMALRMAQQRAPECADVIAALLFWLGVERNRAALRATRPEAEIRNEGIEMAAKYHDGRVAEAKKYVRNLPKRLSGRVLNPEWEAWSDTEINHTEHATAIRALKEPGDE